MLSNIEAVARAICARQIAKACAAPSDLKTDVDRLWGCVAAELEAGLIDDDGRMVENYTVEQGFGRVPRMEARETLRTRRILHFFRCLQGQLGDKAWARTYSCAKLESC